MERIVHTENLVAGIFWRQNISRVKTVESKCHRSQNDAACLTLSALTLRDLSGSGFWLLLVLALDASSSSTPAVHLAGGGLKKNEVILWLLSPRCFIFWLHSTHTLKWMGMTIGTSAAYTVAVAKLVYLYSTQLRTLLATVTLADSLAVQ